MTDEWIKTWYIYTKKYYPTIKRNKIGSFAETWIICRDLEAVIRSKVSQEEKNKYHIFMHIYEIWKGCTDDPICRATKEMQAQRTDLWT